MKSTAIVKVENILYIIYIEKVISSEVCRAEWCYGSMVQYVSLSLI